MDEKEKINTPPKDSLRGKPFTMPIILIVVCVAIIALFGFSLWLGKSNKNDNSELNGTTNEALEGTNTATGNPLLNMTNEQREQARIKDSKRLADIKILNAALDNYFKENESYPEKLENLSPKYLKDIPQDPDGYIYVYTGIGSTPYTYYDLSYNLEVGVEGLESGSHTASPDGIATP